MNIKFLKIVAVALTLAVMAFGLSCKNDKPADNEPDFSGRIAVNLTADIVSPGKLKVANDEWEPSDKVGLFMKKAGLATPDALYEDVANVQTSIVGQKLTASPPVFYPLDGNVDFIAYYPYVPDASIGAGYTIDLNVSGQDAGLPVETLYSNNVVEQAPTTSAVALNFNYSLAKLVVTVKEKSNNYLTADDFAGMLVAVEGMNTQAKLNLLTGILDDQDGAAAIGLYRKGSDDTSATFEALVLPTADEMTFTFTVGGEDYSCVVDRAIAAATQYEFTFLLNIPAPDRTATLLNATITPRDEVVVAPYVVSSGPFLRITKNVTDIEFSADGLSATSGGESISPTFTVNTNQSSWDVDIDETWLTADITGNAFTLVAEENNGAARYATVTVTVDDAAPVTINVTQLELAPELENVALNKPVTVSEYYLDFYGSYAVDGDKTTTTQRWISNNDNEAEHWLEVDLQGSFTVSQVIIYFQPSGVDSNSMYRFQVWSGGAWVDVVSEDDNPWSTYLEYDFAPVTTDKVRLYIPPHPNNWTRLFEIEVYGFPAN